MKKADDNLIFKWVKAIADKDTAAFEKTQTDNTEEFDDYNKTWKVLGKMQEIEQFDTDKAWQNVFSKIDGGEDQIPKQTKVIALNRVLAMAASFLILLAVGATYFFTQWDTITEENNTLMAKSASLPDGSVVQLNSNSKITYNKQFGKHTRTIVLKGEAFFNVTKDKNKPFIVQAQHSFIKVLGTSFNVKAKSPLVEVMVKTGKVEVYNQVQNSEHLVLLPGDFAVLDGNEKVSKEKNSQENYLSWMHKRMVFKAQSLETVATDLMNAYHCSIELSDSSLGSLTITSTFDNDSLEDILASIALALNLSVEQQNEKYILVLN